MDPTTDVRKTIAESIKVANKIMQIVENGLEKSHHRSKVALKSMLKARSTNNEQVTAHFANKEMSDKHVLCLVMSKLLVEKSIIVEFRKGVYPRSCQDLQQALDDAVKWYVQEIGGLQNCMKD